MAKRKKHIPKPPPTKPERCYYQNGKRTFSGTAKDVARYAFRDQYLQWVMLGVIVVLLVLSLLLDIPLYLTTGLAFLKKCVV
ncbi:hypothetical protein [Ferruginibacter sp.]